jgi:pimeloyl-ACP methyl ester carboxylesterase
MHEVIQQVKSPALLGKTFDKIAFVGFSIGGIVANGLADRYPDDVDMFVMLGITWRKGYIYPVFLIEGQAPARRVDPARWGDFEEYYQTQSTLPGRELACFWGDYEPGALDMDFRTRDTDTLGTAVTFTFHLVTAPAYSGPVFLGIGDNDGTFCGASCGSAPYEIYDRFPRASDYDVKVYPRTGHALMYHTVAPEIQRNVRDFIKKHSAGARNSTQQGKLRLGSPKQVPLGAGEL